MKTRILPLFFALVAGLLATGPEPASAEEVKIVGVVAAIELAADAAVLSIKANDSGEVIEVVVTDSATLDKFRDRRIVEGDEVRCKYEVENTQKISKLVRKTAGC